MSLLLKRSLLNKKNHIRVFPPPLYFKHAIPFNCTTKISAYLLIMFLVFYCNIITSSESILLSSNPLFANTEEFRDTPFADKIKIVVDSKIIKIEGIENPFNASIITRDKDSYLIAFRKDNNQKIFTSNSSVIGLVELKKNNFNQQENLHLIDTEKTRPEDPRLFYLDNQIYLLYTYWSKQGPQCRQELGILDREGMFINKQKIAYGPQRIQKNFTPFIYTHNNETSLNFVYLFNPLEIVTLDSNNLKCIRQDQNPSQNILSNWENIWGQIRGGTPALLVDNEYLAFFHSCFTDKNKTIWWVMGAITFEGFPPFNITKISKHPIIASDFYTYPICPSAFCYARKDKNFKILFPCGYTIEHSENKTLFHIVCGENDSAIRMITIDQNELYKNMIEI